MTKMTKSLHEIEAVARRLVAAGKGILAADESTTTIEGRFKAIGLNSTPETRRVYRELLFGAAGIEDAISGIILFAELHAQRVVLEAMLLKPNMVLAGAECPDQASPAEVA